MSLIELFQKNLLNVNKNNSKRCSISMLIDAINSIDITLFEKIISLYPESEILSHRIYFNGKGYDVIQYILLSLDKKHSQSQILSIYHVFFLNAFLLHKAITQPRIRSEDQVLSIITALFKKCPSIISEDILQYLCKKELRKILKLAILYFNDQEKNIDEDFCYICYSGHKYDLISSPCKCNMSIHIDCLLCVVEKMGDRCRTCNENIGSKYIASRYVGIRNTGKAIMIPRINLYKDPHTQDYVKYNDDDFESLYLAIYYMQVKRVEELVSLLDREAFFNLVVKLETKKVFLKFPKINDKLDCNITRIIYPKEYASIESILESKANQES